MQFCKLWRPACRWRFPCGRRGSGNRRNQSCAPPRCEDRGRPCTGSWHPSSRSTCYWSDDRAGSGHNVMRPIGSNLRPRPVAVHRNRRSSVELRQFGGVAPGVAENRPCVLPSLHGIAVLHPGLRIPCARAPACSAPVAWQLKHSLARTESQRPGGFLSWRALRARPHGQIEAVYFPVVAHAACSTHSHDGRHSISAGCAQSERQSIGTLISFFPSVTEYQLWLPRRSMV